MKVVIVSAGYPTSEYPQNGIFAFDQAVALNKYTNNEVCLLSIDLRSIRRKRELGLTKTNISGISVYNYSFPLGRVPFLVYKVVFGILFKLLFREYVKDFAIPDIVHAQFGVVGSSIYKYVKKKNLPLIVTEHSSSLNKMKWSWVTKCRYKKMYHSAKALITVSECLGRNIKANVNREYTVIPNIIDLETFEYVDRQLNKDFTFVSVGNLIKIKNFELLIEAFKVFCSQNPKSKLLIIGDGKEKTDLIKKSKQLGVDKKILFLGRLERNKISNILSSSDAFVLLSNSETFGVAYVEALSLGLPVIATKCGGPEEFVNSENGILVDRNDLYQVVNAMGKIMNNYDQYDSKKISTEIKNKFDPQVIALRINGVYYGNY